MPNHTRREALVAILTTATSPLALSTSVLAGSVYQARFFSAVEMQTLDALTETIIPVDSHSPGARSARVSEYIDVILSEAKPDVKMLWSEGLASMDRLASNAYGERYAQCSGEQQHKLMAGIAANEERPATPEERFFVALKAATIDGYYTSAIDIHQDLEYQGNTAVLEFPGCQHESHDGLQVDPTNPPKAPAPHRH
jgi:gluconate 2-dehydrogenase subunit 3-like protein